MYLEVLNKNKKIYLDGWPPRKTADALNLVRTLVLTKSVNDRLAVIVFDADVKLIKAN